MLKSVEIGTNIVALREKKGLTQEEVALDADLSVSYLRRIEHGRANPTLGTLKKVAEVLGVTLTTLLLFSKKEEELQKVLWELRQERQRDARSGREK